MTAISTLRELQNEILDSIASYGNDQPIDSLVRRLFEVSGAILGTVEGGATQRTPNLLISTTSGSILPGSQSVSIFNAGGATATVLTQPLTAGMSVSWSVTEGRDTLGAVTYNATGTTLIITWVV